MPHGRAAGGQAPLHSVDVQLMPLSVRCDDTHLAAPWKPELVMKQCLAAATDWTAGPQTPAAAYAEPAVWLQDGVAAAEDVAAVSSGAGGSGMRQDMYQLKGIVVHSGTAFAGHYYSYIQVRRARPP